MRNTRPAWPIALCILLMGWGSLLAAFTPVHTQPGQNVPTMVHSDTHSGQDDHGSPCHQPASSDTALTTDAHHDCNDCAQSLCQQLCLWLTLAAHNAVFSAAPPPHTRLPPRQHSPRHGHPSFLLRPPQAA